MIYNLTAKAFGSAMILLAFVLFMVGCGTPVTYGGREIEINEVIPSAPEVAATEHRLGGTTRLHDIVLADGTRCFMASRINAISVQCEVATPEALP